MWSSFEHLLIQLYQTSYFTLVQFIVKYVEVLQADLSVRMTISVSRESFLAASAKWIGSTRYFSNVIHRFTDKSRWSDIVLVRSSSRQKSRLCRYFPGSVILYDILMNQTPATQAEAAINEQGIVARISQLIANLILTLFFACPNKQLNRKQVNQSWWCGSCRFLSIVFPSNLAVMGNKTFAYRAQVKCRSNTKNCNFQWHTFSPWVRPLKHSPSLSENMRSFC